MFSKFPGCICRSSIALSIIFREEFLIKDAIFTLQFLHGKILSGRLPESYLSLKEKQPLCQKSPEISLPPLFLYRFSESLPFASSYLSFSNSSNLFSPLFSVINQHVQAEYAYLPAFSYAPRFPSNPQKYAHFFCISGFCAHHVLPSFVRLMHH